MHPILPEMKAILMFQQMTYVNAYINFISVTCSPHNAKTTISPYQHNNRPIPIISKTADTDCRPIIGASLHSTNNEEMRWLAVSRSSAQVLSLHVTLQSAAPIGSALLYASTINLTPLFVSYGLNLTPLSMSYGPFAMGQVDASQTRSLIFLHCFDMVGWLTGKYHLWKFNFSN